MFTVGEPAIPHTTSSAMAALSLVGTEVRKSQNGSEFYTYHQTKEYVMQGGYDIRHVRYVWSEHMTPAEMTINGKFPEVLACRGDAYIIFCTAPRWSVDFLKTRCHRGQKIHCTFNHPGDVMDTMDTRHDWWTRWCVQTISSAVGGALATSLCKVILLFSVDSTSTTCGSVIEWSLKECIAEVIIQDSQGFIFDVYAAVVDIEDVLKFYQGDKPSLILNFNRHICNEVYLIRHAESVSNVGDDVLDPALTTDGVNQAVELRTFLDGTKFDYVIVSPARRAILTAMYAGLFESDQGQAIVVKDMAEQTTGELQNMLLPSDKFMDWAMDESLPDFITTLVIDAGDVDFLSLVCCGPFGKKIAVVSHITQSVFIQKRHSTTRVSHLHMQSQHRLELNSCDSSGEQ